MRPRVVVLIGVHNGGPFLEAQLRSLSAQTLPPTHICVSDDGSVDASEQIVERFGRTYKGTLIRLTGPKSGPSANYLHLIRHCPPCDMVALCDQDDVWLPEKLEHQWQQLRDINGPAFHGATTWRTDADLQNRTASTFRTVTPGLRHALVQNLAGANTMALNRAGLERAQEAAGRVKRISFHDWWLYQLFAATGARILYEDYPQVLYRQHGRNIMGDNTGGLALLSRASQVSRSQYAAWITLNLDALDAVNDMCTPQAIALVDAFCAMRHAPAWRRLASVARLGLKRHGSAGQITLLAAALAGRL